MKYFITALILSGILISCNSKESETATENSVTKEKVADSSAVKEIAYKPIDSDEALVATALLAAPAESRADATVIGYNMAGEFGTLKEGTNELIVLADDPSRDGFNAACYHKDLDPFMARGRALKAEGKDPKAIFDIREEEMKAGKLSIPSGATLHIYFGPKTNYDPETAQVEAAKLRYVVYLPWATSESTGLPEMPVASNHPWIMNPGTHRAHIMISPLAEKVD